MMNKFPAVNPFLEKNIKEQTIPNGWKKVPSRSRPGEFSYENEKTGERYSSLDLIKNLSTNDKSDLPMDWSKHFLKEKVPEGWEIVPSKSRPGEFSYRNKITGERYKDLPIDLPAELPKLQQQNNYEMLLNKIKNQQQQPQPQPKLQLQQQNKQMLSELNNKQNYVSDIDRRYNDYINRMKKEDEQKRQLIKNTGNEIVTDYDRLVKNIENTFYGSNNELPYYPFFMDPLETKWGDSKKMWVEQQLKNNTLNEINDFNSGLRKYFYGTLWDCGEGYRYLLDKDPKSKYWKYFVSAYTKAMHNRHTIIKKYEKNENGKMHILCPYNKQWIDEDKMYKYYTQGYCSKGIN